MHGKVECMDGGLNRREWLCRAGAAVGAAALGLSPEAAEAAERDQLFARGNAEFIKEAGIDVQEREAIVHGERVPVLVFRKEGERDSRFFCAPRQ